VILYCAGKINTSKAWVAGSSYSPFKTHHADRVDFNQQGWSLIWCVWYKFQPTISHQYLRGKNTQKESRKLTYQL